MNKQMISNLCTVVWDLLKNYVNLELVDVNFFTNMTCVHVT